MPRTDIRFGRICRVMKLDQVLGWIHIGETQAQKACRHNKHTPACCSPVALVAQATQLLPIEQTTNKKRDKGEGANCHELRLGIDSDCQRNKGNKQVYSCEVLRLDPHPENCENEDSGKAICK